MSYLNLLHAAGVGYCAAGAALTLPALASLLRNRSRIVVYPRELALRRARAIDVTFGLIVVALGGIAMILAARGFSAPLSLWGYPLCFAAFMVSIYWVARHAASRPLNRRRPNARGSRIYETRRSRVLREAAERESTKRLERDIAAAPRDRGVIYLHGHWDRHWWSDRLGVTADVLEAAVSRVGCMKHDVERYLSTHGSEVRRMAA